MATDPLDERDLLRFRMLADPQVSPDGREVAFIAIDQDAAKNKQVTSIWVVATDGKSPARRLTSGPSDRQPRWSPSGAQLAFLGAREREWAKDLYVLDMAGGEPRKVAALPRGVADYGWDLQGRRFCLAGGPEFPREPDREPAKDADEQHRRYQERPRYIDRFRYRSDGQGYLDDEPRQIWSVDLDGENLRMLTDLPSDATRPRWAMEECITFLGNCEPDFDRSNVQEIYGVDPVTGQVTRLTHYGRSMAAYSYGPGRALATLRTDTADPTGGKHLRLWVGDDCLTGGLDRTSAPVVLADTCPGREARNPAWHAGHVYFDLADRGSVNVYRALPAGLPEPVLYGRRVIAGFSVGGGVIAFLSTGPDDPLTLRVADLNGVGERVVYDPNPWVREKALGELRSLDFEHDGRAVDGWALLPPGHRDGERVPTIVYIHGGPHAAYGWSFQFVFQVLAGAGYAIVYCNPPGSQSYDEEFATSLRGRWGEMDFPYYMALADLAVDAGFAEGSRLGVGGASYGGYSTLWAISHTDRFRAAVAARPVTSLHGFYGSSDIGWNFGAGSLGVEPWEDPELYQRLSPGLRLDRINTPVRLIASTGDMRTPVDQAEAAFIRLRKMRKTADLVLFWGEPHGIVVAGKPWNRVEHMRAVGSWFDRHLKS